MSGKEFKVNDYITLKLEYGRTNIYVNGKVFNNCKYLAFQFEADAVQKYDAIQSIDEVEQWDRSFDFLDLKISPEEEFWGHCSNLQAWADNDYDTRLLHRTLSFPLLKKLTDVGDKKAKRIFKSEIATRLKNGYPPVIEYLSREGYLNYLNENEIETLFGKCDFIEYKGKKVYIVNNSLFLNHKAIKDLNEIKGLDKIETIKELDLSQNNLKTLPESIRNIQSLKKLYLSHNEFTALPEWIGNLQSLQVLSLYGNKLTSLPESIGKIQSLKKIYLTKNKFITLPDSIENLQLLQQLTLHKNELSTLPEWIGNLTSLQELYLDKNRLSYIPESMGNLASLQFLWLHDNELTSIPESIGNLTSLQELNLKNNKLTTLPEEIGNLALLKDLNLSNNEIRIIPKSIIKLDSLERLILNSNNITSLQEGFTELKSLRKLNMKDNKIKTLPDSSFNLNFLRIINLKKNPIKNDDYVKLRLFLLKMVDHPRKILDRLFGGGGLISTKHPLITEMVEEELKNYGFLFGNVDYPRAGGLSTYFLIKNISVLKIFYERWFPRCRVTFFLYPNFPIRGRVDGELKERVLTYYEEQVKLRNNKYIYFIKPDNFELKGKNVGRLGGLYSYNNFVFPIKNIESIKKFLEKNNKELVVVGTIDWDDWEKKGIVTTHFPDHSGVAKVSTSY